MATPVVAHITGTVFQVEKAVGDAVEAGDVIVILESMKMEMPVEAPETGVIGEIHCQPGDAVEEGAILATIE